jgi:hypothetical protein
MKIKDLTEEDIKNYSEIELLQMDLCEGVDKINKATKNFKTILTHFIAITSLAIMASIVFGFGNLLPLIFFIPSIVLLFILNRKGNDKKTALISFKMSILFYKDSGIIDTSNEYLVKKYVDKINH